jgi:hypothetical protein
MLEYDDVVLGQIYEEGPDIKKRSRTFYIFIQKEVGRYKHIELSNHAEGDVYLKYEYVDRDSWYKSHYKTYDNLFPYLESVKIESMLLRLVIKLILSEGKNLSWEN